MPNYQIRYEFINDLREKLINQLINPIDEAGWSIIDKALIHCPNNNICVEEVYDFIDWLREEKIICTKNSKEFFDERAWYNEIYDINFYNDVCNT